MADQWEEAAKSFKPSPTPASSQPTPQDDGWKLWATPEKTESGSTSPIENAMSHAGNRLSEIPSAIGNMVMHPIDTAKSIYGQQKQLAGEGIDAARSGDYPLAAARVGETFMPGVGPAIANGFKTIRSGDTSGGIGDMMGTVGPALVARGAAMSPKVQAFTRGAAQAATKPTSAHFGPFRVSVPVPAPLAGGVTGSVIGGHFGAPGLGTAIGTVAPLIRGGMREASGEPWLPQAAESAPSPPVPSNQGLLNGGPRITTAGGGFQGRMEAPTDTSYVRSLPAQYPPSTAAGIMDQAQSGSDALAKVPAQAPAEPPTFANGRIKVNVRRR